jgi:predicted nucleic acid-binding Zn ribbon protein
MSVNGHEDSRKKPCVACGKPDDLPIDGKFCSNSCKEVWWWRWRHGYRNPD